MLYGVRPFGTGQPAIRAIGVGSMHSCIVYRYSVAIQSRVPQIAIPHFR